MPLFDFRCTACGEEFEQLVRPSEQAVCPACGGREVQKLLSAFSFKSGGRYSPSAGPSCGGCTSGSCSSCGR